VKKASVLLACHLLYKERHAHRITVSDACNKETVRRWTLQIRRDLSDMTEVVGIALH
jgi:hypothetical protein